MKALVWFRRDLRLQDNSALAMALASGQSVEAVYVHSIDGEWCTGSASKWYLHHSLLALQKDLAAINISLTCFCGSSSSVLPDYANKKGISNIYWNRVVDPQQEHADHELTQKLMRIKIDYAICDDDCLLMPEQGYKKDGTAYRVFTPFWKTVRERMESISYETRLHAKPEAIGRPLDYDPLEVEQLDLLAGFSWYTKLHQYWIPGEISAHDRLHEFIDKQLAGYDISRDIPALNHTSRLSAALHFGEISAARIYSLCQQIELHEQSEVTRRGVRRFLAEIGWREFARHVLHAFPETSVKSLNTRFEQQGFWQIDQQNDFLRMWQQGVTGIDIIDAGMRELWETGTMHNRVRMLTASFLTKNLGIHWLKGARWFWDTLVDADLASNTLGWQWVAGCGTDAAPYYRIFNPQTQANKFDSERHYINRWLGRDSARPAMVDLKTSREAALMRYQSIIRIDH